MTKPPATPEIRRILVAIDASTTRWRVLEAAAALAEGLGAEVEALFVENESVMQLAALPFAREVGIAGRPGRVLDAATVEREFRFVAEAARRALDQAAARHRVRTHFRVVRGRLEAELVRIGAESDLVAIEKSARRPASGRRLGAAARALAARGPAAVLLCESGPDTPLDRIVVAYDASPCAERALRVAARLAHERRPLEVLLLTPDASVTEALRAKAEAELAAVGARGHFRVLPAGDVAALTLALERIGEALLVLGTECLPLPAEALERLLGETGSPVLLIRA